MFKNIGPTEILLILAVVLLFFGAAKLPELARGSGRALRIFKSEIKSLDDDDEDDTTASDRPDATKPASEADTPSTRQIEISRVDGSDDTR